MVHAIIFIIVRLSNALQIFPAVVHTIVITVAITTLHVSYELFRWLYNIFHLKVCVANC